MPQLEQTYESPIISVLMPVYNAERYLAKAVESILMQTFADFEFIIVDDGSTDQSLKILQNYAVQDSRIRLTSRANQGLVYSLNEMIGQARGKFLARMDADDIAMPERFAKQVTFLQAHPECVAVGAQVLLIDPVELPLCKFAKPITHEQIDFAHLSGKGGGSIVHPSVMMRATAVSQIGGYRPEMESAEDLDLFLRLAEIGRLANLQEVLLWYRMHPKSIGHTRRLEQLQKANQAVCEAYKRRGLGPPSCLEKMDSQETSLAALYRKWAWWGLGNGHLTTARKYAFWALKAEPISLQSWKILACTMRGY